MSSVTRAILISLLALLLFDIMGLIIKLLSPRYGAAELSAYRNLFGMIPAVIALWMSPVWRQGPRRILIRQWPLAIVRGVTVTFAQLMFYLSLGLIDFATASTISYSSALFQTAFAVPLLGERVGWVRLSAVIIGFVGVVLITGIGDTAFSWYVLLPVGAASLYALNGVTARMIDADVPTPLMNAYSAGVAAIGAMILALVSGGFSPVPHGSDLAWIMAMGFCGGAAVLCIVIAYRMAEQSTLAPFGYFGIPMAFGLGWLFFGEAPIDDLFPGVLLIAGSGLLIVWRERQMRIRVMPPPKG